MRECRKCSMLKEENEFYKASLGVSYSCKACLKLDRINNADRLRIVRKKRYDENRIKLIKRSSDYQKKNKIKTNLLAKKSRLKIQYGLTLEDYNILYNKQDGKCFICKTSQTELNKDLFVDHCHTTGKVRGLLCYKCNHVLGLLKDNIENAERVVLYLKNNI